jgi:hypothetical protein
MNNMNNYMMEKKHFCPRWTLKPVETPFHRCSLPDHFNMIQQVFRSAGEVEYPKGIAIRASTDVAWYIS